jgi:hypothetical protein
MNSHESDSERRCECGHLEAEHRNEYSWAPGRRFCAGRLLALDEDPDSRGARDVGCLCGNFHAADEYRLREWAERAIVL